MPSSFSSLFVVLISGMVFLSFSPSSSHADLIEVIGIPTSGQNVPLKQLPFLLSDRTATCFDTVECGVTPIRDCVCRNEDPSCCVPENKGEDWTTTSCSVSTIRCYY